MVSYASTESTKPPAPAKKELVRKDRNSERCINGVGQPALADLGRILIPIDRSHLSDKIGILRRLLAWRCRNLAIAFEIERVHSH